MQFSDQLVIGGIPTLRATRYELANILVDDYRAAKRGELLEPRIVVSSNGAVIAAFHRDPVFRELMLKADIVDADGMSLVIASRWFCKRPLVERAATTDFVQDAAAAAAANGIRFYLLGGKPGVAEAASANLLKQHPGLKIVGTQHGYYQPSDVVAICEDIKRTGADVLWLGLGSPGQESFAFANRHRLAGLTWIRTCGGLFDHVAGLKVRAPRWMQEVGLEWLWRAFQEPWRLGPRYLSTNPLAIFHLLTKTHD